MAFPPSKRGTAGSAPGATALPAEGGSVCHPEVCSWVPLLGALPPGALPDLLSPWQPSLVYCVSGS